MKSYLHNTIKNLRYDFPSSIVVFLVALPLCLGIALASGAPLLSGLLSGIIGGIVVGAISGSSLGVSGPAAGLTVIVLLAIERLGFEAFLLAVLFAGVIQIGMGLLKAGVIAYYFPSSVIKGMLSAIGIIIILKQIPHAVGYDNNPDGSLTYFQVDGENTFAALANLLNYISPGAVLIFAVALAILLIWEFPGIKRIPVLGQIPGALLAVGTGIILNIVMSGNSYMGLRSDQLVNIPADLTSLNVLFTFPDFGQWLNPQVYITAFTLAIVASIETLLCVEATDKLDPRKRVTPANRELLAQGTGNLLAGLLGALPVTQVIVRSSANIHSGARTKNSAIIHGILLLVCALSIPYLLNLIPLATLAAILFIVGYKLAKPAIFVSMFRKGKTQFVPFIITVVGIVSTDLLTGIAIGFAVAVVQILWNNYRLPYFMAHDEKKEGDPYVLKFSEDVSFLNKARIQRTLLNIPEGTYLVIDMSATRYIHPDVEELIEEFSTSAESNGIRLEIKQPVPVIRPDELKIGERVARNVA